MKNIIESVGARHFSLIQSISPDLFRGIFLGIFLLVLVPAISCAQEPTDKDRVQKDTSMTLYKTMALVRDKGVVEIKKDEPTVFFQPVSSKIIPQSAVISCSDAHVLEQSFLFRPITPEAILESYVGKMVLLVNTDKKTGAEKTVPARLLSAKNGVVLEVGDKIETTVAGRIAFPGLPQGLGDNPMLRIVLNGNVDKKAPFELVYLTRGISWRADYVAILDKSESPMRLNSWVTVNNNAGISFEDASIQLIAGDVNEGPPPVRMNRSLAMEKAAAPALSQDVSREDIFEYHLYSINRPVSLKKGVLKQISLFHSDNVLCRKEFLVTGNRYPYSRKIGPRKEKQPVQAIVSFKNDKTSALGIPMPQGEVRVFKRDSQGRIQFIGRDHVMHVAVGEEVQLSLGKAFDIVCTRVQTDFKKLAGSTKYNTLYESSYEITVKNTKKEPVSVKFMEPISGTWEITDETLTHLKPDANTAMWTLDVPADSEKALKFTVRVRY